MQKHLSIVAAAALAVGGMGLTAAWAQQTADPNAPAGQTTPSDSLQRAGEDAQTAADKAASGQGLKGTAQAPDAEGIRDVLASSTEAAFTPGGFDDLVERFVDADRNRIGKSMPTEDDLKAMDDQIKSFRQAWKDKYGKEFDIDNEELVFDSSFQIMQSEIGAAARTAGERQPGDPAGASGTVQTPAGDVSGGVTVDPNAPRSDAERATDRTAEQARSVDRPGTGAADANRNDPGRNIATVQVPESHGMPALTVNMVHEFPDAWKIDAPDTVDAAKLRTNLGNVVSSCVAMKDQWPADVNEAYRALGHKVLAAVHDKPISASGAAGAGATGAGGTGATQ